MAQRTISDAGGNWTSTSTWVEGAVPGTSDWVVATATSGNLTISSGAKQIQYIDLTLYTGTLSITGAAARIEVTQNGGTSTLNAGAYIDNLTSYAPSFLLVYQFSGTHTHTIVQVPGSPEIPLIEFISNTPAITLGSDIYLKHCYATEALINTTENNYKVYISKRQRLKSSAAGYNPSKKYADIVMVGEYCYIDTDNVLFINVIPNNLTIDTSGTCSIYSSALYTAPEANNKFFKVLNGDIVGSMGVKGGNWISIQGSAPLLIDNSTTTTTLKILDEFSSDISFIPYRFDVFGILPNTSSSTQLSIVGGTFSGSLNISSLLGVNPLVALDPAYIHSIPNINGSGYLTNKPTLKSTVPGTQATINLGSNTDSILSNVNLTDISVTGSSPLYAYESTLSNTSGVTLVEPGGGGGGGGESAYTYVN